MIFAPLLIGPTFPACPVKRMLCYISGLRRNCGPVSGNSDCEFIIFSLDRYRVSGIDHSGNNYTQEKKILRSCYGPLGSDSCIVPYLGALSVWIFKPYKYRRSKSR